MLLMLQRDSLLEAADRRSLSLQLPYLNRLSHVNQVASSFSCKSPSEQLQLLLSRTDDDASSCVWSVEAGVWQGWLGACNTMSAICSQIVLQAPPSLYHRTNVPRASSETAVALCNVAVALAGQVRNSNFLF